MSDVGRAANVPMSLRERHDIMGSRATSAILKAPSREVYGFEQQQQETIRGWFAAALKLRVPAAGAIQDTLVVREEGTVTVCGAIVVHGGVSTLYLMPATAFEPDSAILSSALACPKLTSISLRSDDMHAYFGTPGVLQRAEEDTASVSSSESDYGSVSTTATTQLHSPVLAAYNSPVKRALRASVNDGDSDDTPGESLAAVGPGSYSTQGLALKQRLVALLDLAIDCLACSSLCLFIDRRGLDAKQLASLVRDMSWVGFSSTLPAKVLHRLPLARITDPSMTTIDEAFVPLFMEL
ncbi:hypothetical protein PYCC9005_005083 [Savitreella phatthalungensis]